MAQSELLKRAVRFLDAAGIAYMITGSYASSLQGAPRSTHDIDIVIQLRFGDVSGMAEAFVPPEFYLDRAAILEAIRHEGTFNVLETHSGDKIDFWILSETAFDQTRFRRRVVERFEDLDISVSSAEDTILVKLKWAKDAGGSEKQFADVLGVFEVQRPLLDLAYLKSWAEKLGVAAALSEVMKQARDG